MSKINKVAKNFFSNAGSNVIAQLLAFLTVSYSAKALGTQMYGNITLIQAMMVYFTLFTLFGLQTFGTREVSKNFDNTSFITGNILFLRLLIFVISFIAITVMSIVFKNDINFRNLLILYGMTLLPSALSIDWVFIGLQKLHYNAVYNIIKSVIPYVLLLLFVKGPNNAILIPLFTFGGLFIGLVYQAIIYFFKEKLRLAPKFEINLFKRYVVFGLPFLLSGILATINLNVDRIVIGFSIGKSAAAIYATAYALIFFLMNVVAMIFAPVFSDYIRLYHINKINELEKLCSSVAKIIILVVVPIVTGGIILSKEIIGLLFPPDYLSGYTAFSILLIYILLLFIRETYGYGLNAWEREKEYLKIVAISAGVNLILNLIFTPLYGINIAASITVVSEIINIVLMKHYAEKVIKIKFIPYIFKVIFPTLVMALVVLFLKSIHVHVVINIIAAAIVYFGAVILFKYMSVEEIKGFLLKKSR